MKQKFPMEVPLPRRAFDQVSQITQSPTYSGFAYMCNEMIEQRHAKLEKADCPELRGEIKILRKMLKLPDTMARSKRPPGDD